jgi:hypothetical protein
MNVKLVRMRSGEDVVLDLIEETDDSLTFCNPIVAIPNGQGTLGFAPWAPLLAGRNAPVTVPKDYIVYMADTQEEIVDQYTQMFSIIETPPSKKLVL